MTFATEKAKQRSERFTLVKLTPARSIGSLVTANNPYYTYSWPHPVVRVDYGGDILTEDAALNANFEWYYDASTQLLTVRLGSNEAPLIMYYELYYTSASHLTTYADPEDSGTAVRDWQPRLSRNPEITQSIQNSLAGVVTIDLSSVQIDDTDGEFGTYLGEFDSFKNKAIEAWISVNGVIQKVFTGRCDRVSRSGGIVSFGTVSELEKLNTPAYFGDSDEESYLRKGAYPSLDPSKVGSPIRMVLAETSRFNFLFPPDLTKAPKPEHLDDAICTSYSDTISISTNRDWILCKAPTAHKTMTFGTSLSFSISPASGNGVLTATCTSGTHNLRVGDIFRIDDGIKEYWPIVATTSSTGYTANYLSVGAGPSGSSTFIPHSCPRVYVFENGEFLDILKPDIDFTCTETATDGGNTIFKIVLDNSSSLLGRQELITNALIHPSTYNLCYLVEPETPVVAHGEVVQLIAESAGVSVDAASITAADADLVASVHTSVPEPGSSSIGTHLSYLQAVLASTLGYAYLDSTGTLNYKIFAAPSPTTTVTEDLIIKDSLSVDFDYADIITKLSAENPHNASADAITDGGVIDITLQSNSRELHSINNDQPFPHVLKSIEDRIEAIGAVRGSRTMRVKFATATEHLDANIGDDVTVVATGVPGGSVDLKITSITKSAERCTVEGIDLLGL